MVYASFKKPENAIKKRENKILRMKKYIFIIIILIFHGDAGIVGILALEEA